MKRFLAFVLNHAAQPQNQHRLHPWHKSLPNRMAESCEQSRNVAMQTGSAWQAAERWAECHRKINITETWTVSPFLRLHCLVKVFRHEVSRLPWRWCLKSRTLSAQLPGLTDHRDSHPLVKKLRTAPLNLVEIILSTICHRQWWIPTEGTNMVIYNEMEQCKKSIIYLNLFRSIEGWYCDGEKDVWWLVSKTYSWYFCPHY